MLTVNMPDFLTLILTLLVLISSVLYIKSYLKWKKMANIINKIPGPKYVPIFGTILDTKGPRTEVFTLLRKQSVKYGPFFRTWRGSAPLVHLMTPEHIEIVLCNSANIAKGLGYEFIKPWLGTGLIIASGSLWHMKRKLLTPTFHFKILEDFMEVFVEKGQKLVNILEHKVNDGYFNVHPKIKHCALDIICKTAMGVEMNAMEDGDSEYIRAVEKMAELIIQRAVRPLLHYDFIMKRTKFGAECSKTLNTLHTFTTSVIKEKKEKRSSVEQEYSEDDQLLGNKPRLSFLDLLLEVSKENPSLTDNDIKDEVDTFMFAGHDTTSTALSYCIFLLGNHLNIQDKVYKELQSIFNGKDRPITMADLKEMKYMEMVIKETLRFYPVVPRIQRTIEKSFMVDNYEIPVGCYVVIHIYDMHHDPKYFPEPEKFDPDRFLPENSQNRHRYAFIPFSAGSRNCIGQKFAMIELKVLLASILRKFSVISLKKPEELKMYHEIVMRSQTGIEMKLKLRI